MLFIINYANLHPCVDKKEKREEKKLLKRARSIYAYTYREPDFSFLFFFFIVERLGVTRNTGRGSRGEVILNINTLRMNNNNLRSAIYFRGERPTVKFDATQRDPR